MATTAALLPTSHLATATSSSTPTSSNHNRNLGGNNNNIPKTISTGPLDSAELWSRLQAEADDALEQEPELTTLLQRTILSPAVHSLEDAIAFTICYRLLQRPCYSNGNSSAEPPMFCPHSLNSILQEALYTTDPCLQELGHNMAEAVILDALAVLDRDPACDTLLEVILYMKGFAALVCHRAARQKWLQMKYAKGKRSMTALFLQSQASAVFGVDIHPAATIGAGILLDHGTGIVIGETARVGDGCTMLHGVTLGGTGKQNGDRHPKVGPHVLIGAGASILGNIQIGAAAKIGAGSIVLQSIPAGATAVGAPAKIIGRALEQDPASTMDENLDQVGRLHKSASLANYMQAADATAATSSTSFSPAMSVTSASDTIESKQNPLYNDAIDEDGPLSMDFPSKPVSGIPKTSSFTNGQLDEPSESIQPVQTRKRSSSVPMDVLPPETCPFREYTRMAESAPKGTVTIVTLRKLLSQLCTSFEVGSTFFELDADNVGYVHYDDAKFPCRFAKALAASTDLPQERIQQLVMDIQSNPSKRPIKR
eukprot:Nitzschia sp. Nitz4//scaffold335_size18684//5600//7308//NITZ4_008769-RA/size18684-augustus-gene-0.11-mRNA-1//1//CDS//3329548273//4652//frame0